MNAPNGMKWVQRFTQNRQGKEDTFEIEREKNCYKIKFVNISVICWGFFQENIIICLSF